MDPIAVSAVVSAIISGAAGEAGSKLWGDLSMLIRRTVRGSDVSSSAPCISEAELAAVEHSPGDAELVMTFAKTLVDSAAVYAEFGLGLETWLAQAQQVITGDVSNSISGGTQHGPVFQGRDFKGLTFNSPASIDAAR